MGPKSRRQDEGCGIEEWRFLPMRVVKQLRSVPLAIVDKERYRETEMTQGAGGEKTFRDAGGAQLSL